MTDYLLTQDYVLITDFPRTAESKLKHFSRGWHIQHPIRHQ